MKRTYRIPLVLLSLLIAPLSCATNDKQNSFLWLEGIEDEKSLEWVEKQNEATLSTLEKSPLFEQIHQRNLAIYQSDDNLPYVSKRGEQYYNFWRDKTNVRGIYRRTSIPDYQNKMPKWETVLDFDKLALQEDENWVYQGMTCLEPEQELCLVKLSRGGSDAAVIREFNLLTKQFVENGFRIPEAKSEVSWIDKDTIYLASDFGEGTMSQSGYPTSVKRWKRGTELGEAKTVKQSSTDHVGTFLGSYFSGGELLNVLVDYTTYYTTDAYINCSGSVHKVDKPDTASLLGYFNNAIFIQLKEDLIVGDYTLPTGAVVYDSLSNVLDGKAQYRLLAQGNERKSISEVQFTKNAILVNWAKDVKTQLTLFKPEENGYVESEVNLPKNGSVWIRQTKQYDSDFLVGFEGFLTPDSMYRVNDETNSITALKQQPSFFDESKFEVKQNFAVSKDGTNVPYFLVISKQAKADKKNPTLIYGYGGFEESTLPYYIPAIGANWLELGGAFVVANIRGGGEYGPKWHQAALKTNRHKSFEDFEAVTKDLIARNITLPKYIGIKGESNGGLLTGVMLTRSPELFNAVVSVVPVLDMLRFHKLLSGSSWIDEYGSPDVPAERDYLASYSPYHNVKKSIDYPAVFFTTSTRDDLVHPAHARKMTALMQSMGHNAIYYENIDGGHAGASNYAQRAYLEALVFTFLHQQLSGD